MIAKVGKKEFEVYAMDFETHNDNYLLQEFENNPDKSNTSIWLGYDSGLSGVKTFETYTFPRGKYQLELRV